MPVKVIDKINKKTKFFCRKNKLLTPDFGRMLRNALIQPNLDYSCPAWYPNLINK